MRCKYAIHVCPRCPCPLSCSDVQKMLHKRRLGSKGLAILQKFEKATQSHIDMEGHKVGGF